MDEWLPIIIRATAIALMFISWLGLVVPIFPGLNLIWIIALVYGLVEGLEFPGWLYLAIMAVLMIIGNLADNVFIHGKARLSGAAWISIIIGYVAGILGGIFLTPVAGIPLAIAGVFVAEWVRIKDWRRALGITREMAFGCGWSVAARLGIGAIMILLWCLWAFANFFVS
jgi:uncharacterized protein YqgC (DUF456 family)